MYEALVAYQTKLKENRESNINDILNSDERFVQIPTHGGTYFISELGRVLSTGGVYWNIMEPKLTWKGSYVNLKSDRFYIKDLVNKYFGLDFIETADLPVKREKVILTDEQIAERRKYASLFKWVRFSVEDNKFECTTLGKRWHGQDPFALEKMAKAYRQDLLNNCKMKVCPEEEWLPVKGAEDNFIISNMGRLINTNTCKELFGSKSKQGYSKVTINKITVFIHVLVAEAFLGYDRKSKMMVDHIVPQNKDDNSLYNLQVISNRLNQIKDKPKFKEGMHNISIGQYTTAKWKERSSFKVRHFKTLGQAKAFRDDLDKRLGDWFFSWIEE